jgi:hypothetical protein
MSACRLACLSCCQAACLPVCHPFYPSIGLPSLLTVSRLLLSFCYSPSYLSCLLLSCLAVILPVHPSITPIASYLVCLSVCLSTDLSAFLPVCRLLLSLCYSPSFLSCLLLSCLPLCLSAILPLCYSLLSVNWFAWLAGSPGSYHCVTVTPTCLASCCPVWLSSCLYILLLRRLFVRQLSCLSVCLSTDLSAFLPVCRLLLSLCYSPSNLSCHLACLSFSHAASLSFNHAACLSVCQPFFLLIFLSVFCLLSFLSVCLCVCL